MDETFAGYETYVENDRHARRLERMRQARKLNAQLARLGVATMPHEMLEQLWQIRLLPETLDCPLEERYGIEAAT